MKTLKKILIATFTIIAFLGVSTMFSSNANVSASKYASKYHYYDATTKVPLKYYLLEPKNNKLVLPSKSFIKKYPLAFKIIKAGTKIEIYSDPVIKSGNNKYYQVVFKSKKYKNLVQGVKGIYPAIEINNFNQLKNMHEVNES